MPGTLAVSRDDALSDKLESYFYTDTREARTKLAREIISDLEDSDLIERLVMRSPTLDQHIRRWLGWLRRGVAAQPARNDADRRVARSSARPPAQSAWRRGIAACAQCGGRLCDVSGHRSSES
jgi:hypothetical protein